jgi:hypothetical protein
VDLAAEPTHAAIASIEWLPGRAAVSGVVLGADDKQVIDAMLGADKAGIGCPPGWPLPFVKFVATHRDGHVTVPADVDGRGWRRMLAYRATDEAVRTLTGLIPLSVAADRSHTRPARSTARPTHHSASQRDVAATRGWIALPASGLPDII